MGEKHDLLTQQLASSPLLQSPTHPPTLLAASALACRVALDGLKEEGEGGWKEKEGYAGVLEMGVVKGGEVYLLEEKDVVVALKRKRKEEEEEEKGKL